MPCDRENLLACSMEAFNKTSNECTFHFHSNKDMSLAVALFVSTYIPVYALGLCLY